MSLYSLPPLFASVLLLGIGLFVLAKNRSAIGITFCLECISAFLWLGGYAWMYSTRDEATAVMVAKVVYTGVVFIPTFFYHFTVSFLHIAKEKKRLVWVAYGFSFAFLWLTLTRNSFISGVYSYYWGYYVRASSAHNVFWPLWSLFYGLSLKELAKRFTSIKNDESERNRLKYVMAAYGFTALALSDWLPNYGVEFYPVGFVFSSCWVMLMAYAIVRHRLMDVSVVLKKTFIYSSLLALLIVPSFAAVAFATEYLPKQLHYPLLGCVFIMVGFVFPRIRFRTERSLENILFRRPLDYREILEGFSHEMAGLADLRQLSERSATTIAKAMDAREVAIYLNAQDGRYELRASAGQMEQRPLSLGPDHPVVARMASSREALHRKELLRGGLAEGTQLLDVLSELKAHLAIPFLYENRLIGFAILTERESAGDYSEGELAVLRTMANQLAVAIENILRHEQVFRLQELDALKNALFSKVSHELRTPLTNILLPLQRVLFEKGEALHPENRKEKEAMLSNGLTLLKRINEILDLSKLESGKMKLAAKPCDLREIVVEVVAAASPAATSMGLSLSFEPPAKLPPVYVAPEQVQKIFANLIGNSMKFTDRGGKIWVEVREEEESVVISVCDTGCGIPQSELPFIFDRFRQVDGTTSRMYQGTGLGLSLVKELVELHKGRVEVESEQGKGSIFRVRLRKGRAHLTDEDLADQSEPAPGVVPFEERRRGERRRGDRRHGDRRRGNREDEQSLRLLEVQFASFRPPTPREAEQAVSEPADASRRRVLVVEDNRDLAGNIASALRPRYSVAVAYDGQQGLEIARRISPDVIVSDVMMPRMDGFELCRTIKSEPGGDAIPVILLTAKAEVEDRIAGFRQGADHYLAKPFNANELTVVIESLLSRYDLQREVECANTQLQQALQELAEAQVQLVHSARIDSVGELAAGVAHEVKNSIYCVRTGLSGLEKRLQYIQEGKLSLDASYPEMLQAFHVNGQALDRSLFIVNSLLDFSRTSRDGMTTSDVVKGIENTLAILTPRVRDKLELQIRCDGSLPVECKIEEINQVLMNLVLNAYQAIPEHGSVVIEAQERSDSVALRITDDGPGIPEAQLGKIFLPFFTTKEKSGNSGLGLSIAHNIVKAHHGEIQVESRLGQGTTFTITLPKRQPVAAVS